MRIVLLAIVSALAMAAPAIAQDQGAPVVEYSDVDSRMNAAVSRARDTLPVFWARMTSPARDGSEALKVMFPIDGGEGAEHLWVDNLRMQGDEVIGDLQNQPGWIAALSKGDTVVVERDDISDWIYESNGRLWGGFTLRVMVDDLSEAEGADLRAWLSETPLEATAD